MALEQRHGNVYYYRKRKIGGRVISEYCGGGLAARLGAALDQADRERRGQEREIERAARTDSPELVAFYEQSRVLLDAALLLGGYHRHKRQWRKRRERC